MFKVSRVVKDYRKKSTSNAGLLISLSLNFFTCKVRIMTPSLYYLGLCEIIDTKYYVMT